MQMRRHMHVTAPPTRRATFWQRTIQTQRAHPQAHEQTSVPSAGSRGNGLLCSTDDANATATASATANAAASASQRTGP